MLASTRDLEDRLPATLFPDGPLSLVRRWRDVARALPHAVAAVDPGDAARPSTSYTFAEVDRLSDLVALDLVAALGDSELPVPALLGHDANAVVALIALLKTGRIRVVLDTHLPVERLRTIVEAAGSRILLADDRHVDLARTLDLDVRLSLDSLLADAVASTVTADDLASRVATELALGEAREGRDPFEIVFTSGSTGTPKGVVQLHSSFLNETTGHKVLRRFTAGETVAVVLPLSFVAGSANLLITLFGGATAYLVDPRDTGVGGLLKVLRTEHIVTLTCTPHLLRGILSGLAAGEILPDLRTVVTLGEAIHGRDVTALLAHLGPDASFLNEVGASEIVSFATFSVRQGDTVPEANVPAGHAFQNKAIRIVREDGSAAAPGEAGEILVVSDYVSGGYWKNDELNAEKFGVDDDGHAFVRQGDLGRMDERGVVQLLGRGDAGVKVRGYLVEPSEIEGALLSMDEIAEAVVIPQVVPGSATRLLAYVVPKQGARSPSTAAIRRSLRAVLPEYMVPAEILQLTGLPRTERGKVDRQALPDIPERVVDVYEMNQRELAMSTIWQQVLEREAVGRDDDFMALGGDSLSAEELLTLVKEHFGVEVASADILGFPTLRDFTAHVVSGASVDANETDHVTFNKDATGTPYFAFAGAGALALTFLPLSRHLDGTVYAFQQHALERRAAPDRTVEATVARHLRTIREVRPHGPYRLIGHSFGGLIALETARRLSEEGEVVESLVILDTFLPRYTADDASTAGPRTLRERFLPDGLPDREHLGRQVRARLAGIWRHAGQRQYDAFYDLAVLMIRRHVLLPYSGRTVLVIANDNPDGAAWGATLTGDRIDLTMVAEHTSILREPYVATLAAMILPHLASA